MTIDNSIAHNASMTEDELIDLRDSGEGVKQDPAQTMIRLMIADQLDKKRFRRKLTRIGLPAALAFLTGGGAVGGLSMNTPDPTPVVLETSDGERLSWERKTDGRLHILKGRADDEISRDDDLKTLFVESVEWLAKLITRKRGKSPPPAPTTFRKANEEIKDRRRQDEQPDWP